MVQTRPTKLGAASLVVLVRGFNGQIEELYHGEGPISTLPVENKWKYGTVLEHRLPLWGTDASGMFIEVIVAPYPDYGVWRCVTAFPMSAATRKAYLKRIKRVRV